MRCSLRAIPRFGGYCTLLMLTLSVVTPDILCQTYVNCVAVCERRAENYRLPSQTDTS